MKPHRRLALIGAYVTFAFCIASPAFAASFAYQEAVLNDGPVLYYQVNEAAGDAINYGSLGPAYNAVYHGGVIRNVAALSGDAGVAFDSVDDYLESLTAAPLELTGNPTFTTETLVYIPIEADSHLWPPFLHWGQGGTGQEVYFSLQNDLNNKVYAGFYNGGLRMQDDIELGAWHHIVWVRQSGGDAQTGSTLYVDGVSVELEADVDLCCNSLVPAVQAATFRINRARDGTRFFEGTMDEVALYNRALSVEEVTAHYQAFLICEGDANTDDVVDPLDVGYVLARLGCTVDVGDEDCYAADVNFDNSVDPLDAGYVLARFGACQ